MLTLGPLAFAAPWFLAALTVLPVIWWLLRATPPAPSDIVFPPTRIIATLSRTEETPARTPWPLLLLRLLAAASVIVGLSRPLIDPSAAPSGSGPLIVVLNDGWAAAQNWSIRQETMLDLIARAESGDRAVILLPTAQRQRIAGEESTQIRFGGLMRASDARTAARTMQPNPWEPDLAATLRRIQTLDIEGSANVFWLSDGLRRPGQRELAEALQRLGGLDLFVPGPADTPKLLRSDTEPTGATRFTVRRSAAAASLPETVFLRAVDSQGRLLAREPIQFKTDAVAQSVRFDLPVELRNRMARIMLEGEETAAGLILTDDRWKRRPVGVAAQNRLDSDQPLIGDDYYIMRALSPFGDIRRGKIKDLLNEGVSVLVLPDATVPDPTQMLAIADWVARGGFLIRFAGPNLAKSAAGQGASAEGASAEGALIPVRLRGGDRVLGGALSWSKPARLAPFDETGPFFGLSVSEEVTVSRQVLAEPSLDLAGLTWARLADGTPLVTSAARGKGRIVLFHITSNADWSDLPLSGLFVEMLRRILALSKGVSDISAAAGLAPLQSMDAFGRLDDPTPGSEPIEARLFSDTIVSPDHPPGIYGDETSWRALNLGDHLPADARALAGIDDLPSGVDPTPYRQDGSLRLKPALLAAALVLALIDTIAMLRIRGFGRSPSGAGRAAMALAIAALTTMTGSGGARADEMRAMAAALKTRMGYIETGIPERDRITRAGLIGLTGVLQRRTAAELAEPHAIDPETDDLAPYPVIYWAIEPDHPPLSRPAIASLNRYMENGGILFIDTRDRAHVGTVGSAMGSGAVEGPGARRLLRIARGLKIPPLTPIDPDHVLTKAFYLLQGFPGRYAGGDLWVEAPESIARDGVSSIVLGSNDYASAWAQTRGGAAMFPAVPAGDAQREMAYRVGVNLAMYALTGNYKSDQVHVPAILERLGQ